MKPKTWKILAIVFMSLFILETAWMCWGYYIYYDELDKTNICYYDICENYPQAYYMENVCECYEVGVLGDFEVVKQEYMK